MRYVLTLLLPTLILFGVLWVPAVSAQTPVWSPKVRISVAPADATKVPFNASHGENGASFHEIVTLNVGFRASNFTCTEAREFSATIRIDDSSLPLRGTTAGNNFTINAGVAPTRVAGSAVANTVYRDGNPSQVGQDTRLDVSATTTFHIWVNGTFASPHPHTFPVKITWDGGTKDKCNRLDNAGSDFNAPAGSTDATKVVTLGLTVPKTPVKQGGGTSPAPDGGGGGGSPGFDAYLLALAVVGLAFAMRRRRL